MSCDTALRAAWHPSPNHEPRLKGLKPDLLLLHYTAMDCGKKAIKWLSNPEAKVSSHYLIDEDGSITQMVKESERAWHAGVSFWAGETDINSCSIGIEIQNQGHALAELPEFPEVQVKSIIALCKDIIQRHNIPANRVLGHSDVAFGRKIDPGEAFPWERLHQEGIGHWVQSEPIIQDKELKLGDRGAEVGSLQSKMLSYGYGLKITSVYDEATKNAVSAFQSHWRQKLVNGVADFSTIKTLEQLSAKIDKN